MFAMLEDYDVQETRRIARTEGMEKGMEKGIRSLTTALMELNISKETILGKLQTKFDLSEAQALTWYNKLAN